MNVTLIEMSQNYSLTTREIENYVTIALPSGRTVRARVDDDGSAAIISESVGGRAQEPELVVPLPGHVEPDFSEAMRTAPLPRVEPTVQRHPPSAAAMRVVDWEELPEEELPEHVKDILRRSQIANPLPLSEVASLKFQILERLRQAEETTPKPGQVNWNQGPQRPVRAAPRRTVPMDGAGNPLPPGGIAEPDPGEVSEDDEQVSQL